MGVGFTVFAKIARRILSMRISEFMERYGSLLPAYGTISESDSIESAIRMVKCGKHYIVVVDSKGRVKGVLSYLDILLAMGGRRAIASFSPLASLALSLGRIKVPPGILIKAAVRDIVERRPHYLKDEESVEEAVDVMFNDRLYHVVVVDRNGRPRGVLTAHAIFRAIMKELERVEGEK